MAELKIENFQPKRADLAREGSFNFVYKGKSEGEQGVFQPVANPFQSNRIQRPTNSGQVLQNNVFGNKATSKLVSGQLAEEGKGLERVRRRKSVKEEQLNSIINANIQNNIKTLSKLPENKVDSFSYSVTNSKRNGSKEDHNASNKMKPVHSKKKKIDLNKSANFRETMSKIFSDLNKTLDVVNLSVGRNSSCDSKKSRKSKTDSNLMNIFKNNFESEEKINSKRRSKGRSKSWFEVTKEFNEKLEILSGNSPEKKNKSKSLIMTDINEFCVVKQKGLRISSLFLSACSI